MVVVPRRDRIPRPTGFIPEIESVATKWFINYREKKRIEQEQEKGDDALRPKLLTMVKNLGVKEEATGHVVYAFKQSLGGLYGLKAQRAVSVGWDEVAAATVIRGKPQQVQAEVISTEWQFRRDKMEFIAEVLDKAGVLTDCLEDGYPMRHIDADLVLGYHQRHKDVITEAEVDQMMPDIEKWSLIPLTEPVGDIGDRD